MLKNKERVSFTKAIPLKDKIYKSLILAQNYQIKSHTSSMNFQKHTYTEKF